MSESFNGAVGAIIVSSAAVAIGTTAIPGPVTDASDDGWFMWTPFSGQQGIDSSVDVKIFPFDSRAMRRLQEGFEVVFVIETGSADGIRFNFAASVYATRN